MAAMSGSAAPASSFEAGVSVEPVLKVSAAVSCAAGSTAVEACTALAAWSAAAPEPISEVSIFSTGLGRITGFFCASGAANVPTPLEVPSCAGWVEWEVG